MARTKKAASTESEGTGTGTAKTAELNIVRMTDGRDVEFTGKRKLLKTPLLNEKGVGVRLDFVNGQTRDFYIPATMLEKFAVHGAEQKLGDEIAGVEDIDDCTLAIDDLIDRLYNNEWAAKREANALAGASILAKALVQVFGKTLDEVRAFLKDKSQAEKVALRNNSKVKPIVDDLEAAKNAKKKPGKAIDTDSLLDSLTSGAVHLTSTEGATTAEAETADAAA